MEGRLISLMIVDDDSDIRNGLFENIDWNAIGFNPIAQAIDGLDAIEKIKAQMPDVVLTDIRMEQMDGMELIDYLSIHYPKIRIVLLSGYSDVEYYRQALKYKVFDFILKPTHPDNFEDVFSRLREEMQKEKRKFIDYITLKKNVQDNNRSIRQGELVKILEEGLNEEECNEVLERYQMSEYRYNVYLITTTYFPNNLENAESIKLKNTSYEEIEQMVESILDNIECVKFRGNQGEMITICKADQLEDIKNRLKNNMFIDEYSLFSGVSHICPDLYRCKEYYNQSLIAMRQISFIYKECVICYDDLKSYPQAIKVEFDIKLILHSLFYKQDNEWETEINRVFHNFNDVVLFDYDYLDCITNNLYYGVINQLKLIYPNLDETENFYTKISSILNLDIKRAFLIRTFSIVQILAMESKGGGRAKVISEIDRIINLHYTDTQLSLTYISEQVQKSAAYISNIYKQETGSNINDVITQKRIEYAKKLLEETNEKTYRIAEEIGYADCSYFTKLFKKNVGVSPGEYRNSLRR